MQQLVQYIDLDENGGKMKKPLFHWLNEREIRAVVCSFGAAGKGIFWQ